MPCCSVKIEGYCWVISYEKFVDGQIIVPSLDSAFEVPYELVEVLYFINLLILYSIRFPSFYIPICTVCIDIHIYMVLIHSCLLYECISMLKGKRHIVHCNDWKNKINWEHHTVLLPVTPVYKFSGVKLLIFLAVRFAEISMMRLLQIWKEIVEANCWNVKLRQYCSLSLCDRNVVGR